jgi:hypoxanthine phosphoribosyltransferase
VIKVNDKYFESYLSEETISNRVSALADEINVNFNNKELVFIVILNGAFMFASDLIKKVTLPCEVSFVKLSSYQGMQTTGRVDEVIGLNTSITGKNVVIIEDIVDTGITIGKVRKLLHSSQPASVSICTLLFKPQAFHGDIIPEIIGFSIPNDFVVGYGLDYDEKGRNLPCIYKIKAL